MKRIASLLLSAALMLSPLSACQGPAAGSNPAASPSAADMGPTAREITDTVFPVSGFDGAADVECLTTEEGGRGFLESYLGNAYGIDVGTWEDAAVIRATGASAFELAVLRLRDGDAAVRAASDLMGYISKRQGDFAGYAPAEAEMAASGSVKQKGLYAALFICPDTGGAEEAFEAALSGESLPVRPEVETGSIPDDLQDVPGAVSGDVPNYPDRWGFIQPNKDDMSLYDTSAIRAAWAAGDPSPLSGYDRDIYNAAETVLDKVLGVGMDDLEKETAIYHWVVNHVNYDWTHQDVMKETPRESFTPYGGLVNHTAVCLGYAATFQLLMDLAGVECITVSGAAFSSQEDHAWNMVRLNGAWYCVDATWDANYRELGSSRGRESDWEFFNITSDRMAETDHQWDYANIPEAVTEGNGRG